MKTTINKMNLENNNCFFENIGLYECFEYDSFLWIKIGRNNAFNPVIKQNLIVGILLKVTPVTEIKIEYKTN